MKNFITCIAILVISCATTKYIRVNTNPSGAIIEVNGIAVGHAPTTFWIKGSAQAFDSYTVSAIPTDITNEIKFVKQLLILRQTTGTEDLMEEYIETFGEPHNINKETVKQIFSYLINNKNKGTVDELLMEYSFIQSMGTQYTQTKVLWSDEIFRWQHDTLTIYFDMYLEAIPEKYEIEIK